MRACWQLSQGSQPSQTPLMPLREGPHPLPEGPHPLPEGDRVVKLARYQMMYTLKQNQGTHTECETDNRAGTGCGDSVFSVRNYSRPKAHSNMAVWGSKDCIHKVTFFSNSRSKTLFKVLL